MDDSEKDPSAPGLDTVGTVHVDSYGGATSIAGIPLDPPAGSVEDALAGNLNYNFSHPRRGLCIIINNRFFEKRTLQDERIGTDVDAEALTDVFLNLGFEVERYDNLTAMKMEYHMQEAARQNHSDADCFVCCILSHGEEGRIYGTDMWIKIDQLINPFKGANSPTLVGKPKLFIIQACRGRGYDEGVDIQEDEDEPDAKIRIRRIPTEADFMMAFSVVPGYFSWRNSVDGSWFVQGIKKVFQKYGKELELMQLMTLVSKVVAEEFASDTGYNYSSNNKQVPSIVSRLTKFVYFKDKK